MNFLQIVLDKMAQVDLTKLDTPRCGELATGVVVFGTLDDHLKRLFVVHRDMTKELEAEKNRLRSRGIDLLKRFHDAPAAPGEHTNGELKNQIAEINKDLKALMGELAAIQHRKNTIDDLFWCSVRSKFPESYNYDSAAIMPDWKVVCQDWPLSPVLIPVPMNSDLAKSLQQALASMVS